MSFRRIEFVAGSRDELLAFPPAVRRNAGYQLERLQSGRPPFDWKPMSTIGPGVQEVRISGEDGTYRVFYVLNRPEAIYVLHAFKKTSQKTPARVIDLARHRFKSLIAN